MVVILKRNDFLSSPVLISKQNTYLVKRIPLLSRFIMSERHLPLTTISKENNFSAKLVALETRTSFIITKPSQIKYVLAFPKCATHHRSPHRMVANYLELANNMRCSETTPLLNEKKKSVLNGDTLMVTYLNPSLQGSGKQIQTNPGQLSSLSAEDLYAKPYPNEGIQNFSNLEAKRDKEKTLPFLLCSSNHCGLWLVLLNLLRRTKKKD